MEKQGNKKKTQDSRYLKLWECHAPLLYNSYDSIFKSAVGL